MTHLFQMHAHVAMQREDNKASAKAPVQAKQTKAEMCQLKADEMRAVAGGPAIGIRLQL